MNITYKLKKLIKKLSLGDWRAKKRRQFRLLKIYWRKATTRGLKIRVISAYLRVSTDLLVVIVILGVMIAQPLILLLSSRHASAVKYVNYTTNLYPDGDSTRTWASFTDGNAGDGETCDATHHYFCVNEASTATSDYINTGTAGTTGETEDYTVQNPSLGPGTFDTTTAVRVKWHADTAACNGNAPNCDSVSVNIFINGALQTAQTTTMTTTATTYTTTFTGSWAAINDLRIVFVRNRVGGGSAASADDDLRLYQAYADVDYRMVVTSPKLAMTGYVWENDDSSAADTASQLAIGGTAVTVPIGSRMNLRAQIKNTGGGLDAEKLGLFYDNGSGQWSKVKSATKKNTTSSPDLTTIDSSTLTGQYSSVAIDTAGNPWISYQDTSNSELRVAQYVGSGGSGCASTAWTCLTVDSVSSVTGDSTSIGFNPSGVAYISYIDETAFDLRVAHYVGSGGSGCTSSAWTCESADTAVASTDIFNPSTSIAFGSTGNPWISYNFHNGGTLNEDLRVAQYVGSGGTGCGNTTWLCTNVHITGNSGSYSSIAVDDSGTAWVSFNILTSSDLAIAKYVGSGGSGCNSSAWTCTTIAATNLVGDYNSIAIDPAGNPWISYYDSSGNNLQIAKFVTSGGNCDTVAGGSDAWDCTTVDSTNLVGSYTSLAFDPAGNPWISYYDESGHNLRVARYDGDGTASGCADNAWTCTDIDTSNDVGSYSSLAFDPSGNAWISEYNATSSDLRVAEIVGGGEILMAPSERLSGGDAISESHSDMTALPDNTNRDDADCVGGGTWANGKYFESEEGSGLTMADGSGTAQCTEVMFTIDLSQAVVGTTYRFMIATNDGTKMFKGMWRGPISATAIPTLTVADISMIAAKDNNIRLPDCPTGSSSGWGCITVDDATDDTGRYSSIAFSPSGAPYASYYDATTLSLMVAQYVGSGGSGCGASGSSAWTCTKVDEDTDGTGQYSSLAFSPSGVPYASYYDSTATALMVAQYVGSGGTGCGASGSSAWTCTVVDDETDDVGSQLSLAFSPSGEPYIGYVDFDSSSLKVAKLNRPNVALNLQNQYTNPGRNATGSDARYRQSLGRSASVKDGTCGGGTADYLGMCSLFQDNGDYDTISAQINESPYQTFAMRFSTNAELPTASWVGNTTLAPSTAGTTGDIKLEVYRYGSTNAWESVASDTATSDCSARCSLSGLPSGTASEYFNSSGGYYWVYFRLYQEASSSSAITFKTDQFKTATSAQKNRGGSYFQDGQRRPLNWR